MGEAEVETGVQTQTETETQTQTQKKDSTDSVEPRQGQKMYYKGRPAHDSGRRGPLCF
jgi:hypothetical protein